MDDTFSPAARLVRNLRSHVRVTGFGLAVLALGLLIWARLMLVTNHPRVAVAEPTNPIPVAASQANPHDPGRVTNGQPTTSLAAHGE